MSGYPGEDSPVKENRVAPYAENLIEQIMADFASHANILEAEARDLEDRMLAARSRAAAMRTGVAGLQAAMERYHQEMKQAQEFADKRDMNAGREPAVNYGDFPERKINVTQYDSRAHANRMP